MKTTLIIKENPDSNGSGFSEDDLFQPILITEMGIIVLVIPKYLKSKVYEEIEKRNYSFEFFADKNFESFIEDLEACNIYKIDYSKSDYKTFTENLFCARNKKSGLNEIGKLIETIIPGWLTKGMFKTLFKYSDVDKLQEEYPGMKITKINKQI